ncbi:hypothetical protein LA080_009674 [Diaporthe eres]|nr:hypothetical protein LA080_009674 [Diaporthe eres]
MEYQQPPLGELWFVSYHLLDRLLHVQHTILFGYISPGPIGTTPPRAKAAEEYSTYLHTMYERCCKMSLVGSKKVEDAAYALGSETISCGMTPPGQPPVGQILWDRLADTDLLWATCRGAL